MQKCRASFLLNPRWYRPVVEEQFLPGLDGSLGKDPYPVIPVHHHDYRGHTGQFAQRRETLSLCVLCFPLLTFCIAVRVDRMVGKADLISFPCGINNKVWEEQRLVVDDPPSTHMAVSNFMFYFVKLYQALFFTNKRSLAEEIFISMKLPDK